MSHLTDLTTQCIRCGFCLEACPTFVLTGEETESPRGRIYLARSAEEGNIAWHDARPHVDQCLGCLACTTACPSGVKYGEILEIARERTSKSVPKKVFLSGITKPGQLRLQLSLGRLLPGKRIPRLLSRLLSGEVPEADRPVVPMSIPRRPLDETQLPPVRGKVAMLEGCAMRVLYPGVNEATVRLLRRVGLEVWQGNQGCCGALHAHNSYRREAIEMRDRLFEQLPAELPIVVNSAGCGSWLKDSDRANVFDISEFLVQEGLPGVLRRLPEKSAQRVAYHDACHLAHGQGIRSAPRDLLNAVPGLNLVEIQESDMCCGSAGIYNVLQPKMARELLERKWKNIEDSGADCVVMGNPGCQSWIGQAAKERGSSIRVQHTLEVIEDAFD